MSKYVVPLSLPQTTVSWANVESEKLIEAIQEALKEANRVRDEAIKTNKDVQDILESARKTSGALGIGAHAVIPAHAGIQGRWFRARRSWIPGQARDDIRICFAIAAKAAAASVRLLLSPASNPSVPRRAHQAGRGFLRHRACSHTSGLPAAPMRRHEPPARVRIMRPPVQRAATCRVSPAPVSARPSASPAA